MSGIFQAFLTCLIWQIARLGTSFGYIPQHRAPPSTELRHAAYVEGGQMAGPEADPDGWHVLEPISIQGTLFESRTVEIQCTVSLRTPLPSTSKY